MSKAYPFLDITPIDWVTSYSTSSSKPLEDINRAMAQIRGYDQNLIYCSACGNEIHKGLVVKHVCCEDNISKRAAHLSYTCVNLNFCNDDCETFWCLKNSEFLQPGIHGQGYRLHSEEQVKLLTCPANRKYPPYPMQYDEWKNYAADYSVGSGGKVKMK